MHNTATVIVADCAIAAWLLAVAVAVLIIRQRRGR